MKVLIACEFSGIVRDAFIAQGHDALSCDLLPTERPGPHYQGDVLELLSEDWDLMIAHPPCTRLANSGVRWLSSPPRGKTLTQMWDDFEKGVLFYQKFQEAQIPRKAIENPIMHGYALMRIKPSRSIVQPWWFGDRAFKATGFELTNLPPLVPTNKLVPPSPGTPEHSAWSSVFRESPGKDRWKNRSRTFPGIADAMAKQWGSIQNT